MKTSLLSSWLITCVLFMTGCSLQLISPYDERTLNQLESIDQDIDLFYLTLASSPKSERTYESVSARYITIDVQIRSLERRQKMRNLNTETELQAKILASLWLQDIAAHKKTDTVSDFIIQRRIDQYRRLMDTLIKGEIAKKL